MKRAMKRESGTYEGMRIGKRMTQARRELINLLTNASSPSTIQELARQTAANEASVYRTVKLLRDEGLLREIHYPDGAHRYEIEHAHHDHAICTSCGYTEHIPCSLGVFPHTKAPQFKTITAHEITYYGLCTKCG